MPPIPDETARMPALLDPAAAQAMIDGFPKPTDAAARKDIGHLDIYLRRFIELSSFCCISSADAAGH